MAVTTLTEVTNQIQKFWSPVFMSELRSATLLPGLVNKEYQGEIKLGGDTVYVSQINAPTGQLLTVGTDADSFTPEALSTSRVSVVADKRAVASFEFQDLAQLQSQIDSEDSEIRSALMYAVEKKISAYLYSLVAPSASSPDHIINSVTTFDETKVADARMRAAQAKWNSLKPWWLMVDPSYNNDIMNAAKLTSRDYVGDETPIVGGQAVNKRFGFNILEDNSLAVDQAVAFHPDFLHLVMQTQPTFKISDKHALNKFGYVISCDLIFGGKLGISGSSKHQLICADASATTVVMA